MNKYEKINYSKWVKDYLEEIDNDVMEASISLERLISDYNGLLELLLPNLNDLRDEKWNPIIYNGIDYSGMYAVSSYGKVISLSRKVKNRNGNRNIKPKFLSLTINKEGYCKVSLTKDSETKSIFVHRLVATAFIENTLNKPFINHKDLNPLNNNVNNIEWCTQKENVHHAIENGRWKTVIEAAKNKSENFNSHLRKRIVQLKKDNTLVQYWDGIGIASRKLGVSHSLLSVALNNKVELAYGYKWMFEDEYFKLLSDGGKQ